MNPQHLVTTVLVPGHVLTLGVKVKEEVSSALEELRSRGGRGAKKLLVRKIQAFFLFSKLSLIEGTKEAKRTNEQ